MMQLDADDVQRTLEVLRALDLLANDHEVSFEGELWSEGELIGHVKMGPNHMHVIGKADR